MGRALRFHFLVASLCTRVRNSCIVNLNFNWIYEHIMRLIFQLPLWNLQKWFTDLLPSLLQTSLASPESTHTRFKTLNMEYIYFRFVIHKAELRKKYCVCSSKILTIKFSIFPLKCQILIFNCWHFKILILTTKQNKKNSSEWNNRLGHQKWFLGSHPLNSFSQLSLCIKKVLKIQRLLFSFSSSSVLGFFVWVGFFEKTTFWSSSCW